MSDLKVRFVSPNAEFSLPLVKADSFLRYMRGDNARTTETLMLVLRGEPQTFKFKSQVVTCALAQ